MLHKYTYKQAKLIKLNLLKASTTIPSPQANKDEAYLAKHLIKYNNYQFKPNSSSNEIIVGDLLKEFASGILNKNMIPSITPLDNKTNTQLSGLDLVAFDKDTMTYIQKDDNIFNHRRIDISKANYDNESLIQRYIKPNLTNQYSPKFQNELNSLLAERNLEIKTQNLISNAFSRNKDLAFTTDKISKMLISNFISINSNEVKPIEVNLNLSKHQISSMRNLFIVPKTFNSTEVKSQIPEKIIPITTRSFEEKGFQDCLCEGFTILRKLSILSNRPNEIGVVTDLNKWFFINYLNSFSKVETLDNFQISSPYVFNMQNVSLEGKKQFTYFINVLESIIENKEDKLKVVRSI